MDSEDGKYNLAERILEMRNGSLWNGVWKWELDTCRMDSENEKWISLECVLQMRNGDLWNGN